jgi:tetratricopeptide (TPR) repeat protein
MAPVPKEWVTTVSLAAAALFGGGFAPSRAEGPLFAPPPIAPTPVQATTEPAPHAEPTARTAPSVQLPSPLAVQVQAASQRASQMAAKGMLYSARDELVQVLSQVAQAIDVQEKSAQRSAALAAALAALAEAEDFAPPAGDPAASIDVALVARAHRTPILRETRGMSSAAAQQHYLQFAREQLTAAVSPEPAASQALFTLGKVHAAMAGPSAPSQSLHGPRAIVLYQAALAVDPANFLAANELGVLLARYGQWQDARRALVHSVSIRPHAEGWQNLALVHRQLGETELARLADNERQLIAGRPSARKAATSDEVRWIEPQQFAAQAAAQERR